MSKPRSVKLVRSTTPAESPAPKSVIDWSDPVRVLAMVIALDPLHGPWAALCAAERFAHLTKVDSPDATLPLAEALALVAAGRIVNSREGIVHVVRSLGERNDIVAALACEATALVTIFWHEIAGTQMAQIARLAMLSSLAPYVDELEAIYEVRSRSEERRDRDAQSSARASFVIA